MKLDIDSLRNIAETSPDGEAFAMLRQMGGFRIGVGVDRGQEQPFLEVTFPLTREGRTDFHELERKFSMLRRMSDSGYTITSEADMDVTCVRLLPPAEIASEVERTLAMIAELDSALNSNVGAHTHHS